MILQSICQHSVSSEEEERSALAENSEKPPWKKSYLILTSNDQHNIYRNWWWGEGERRAQWKLIIFHLNVYECHLVFKKTDRVMVLSKTG